MTEKRLLIEERIYYAALKLHDIHWEIAREKDTNQILGEIEKVQLELQKVKQDLLKEEFPIVLNYPYKECIKLAR